MTVAQSTRTPIDRKGFLPIGVDTIIASTELPFDLFMQVNPNAPPILYRESQLVLEGEDFQRFSDQEVTTLFIRVDDHRAYGEYLTNNIIRNPEVPAARRLQVLKVANQAVFQSAFGSRRADKMVNFAAEYGDELVEIVSDENLSGREAASLMEHDYYTYTHATNVSVVSLLIAKEIGLGVYDGIVALASGAVLHDVGKRQIAPALLNQTARLTPEQFETIKRHPQFGFEELCERQDLLWGQLMTVYQHHERWDGRGYPVGFVGEEIHLWARICSVADVFDATASTRPYRAAMPMSKVWDIIDNGAGREFDPECVKALKSAVQE